MSQEAFGFREKLLKKFFFALDGLRVLSEKD